MHIIPHGAIRSRSYKAGHYPDLLPDGSCHDEDIKAFLLKVSIRFQHLRYLPLPHQHHGKAVSQAIALLMKRLEEQRRDADHGGW